MAIPDLMAAEKSIPVFSGWAKPEEETGYSWFNAAVEIGGVVVPGLMLHGGCYADKPECNVTFELRLAKTPGRRCTPLARIDWRSLKGGHTNPRVKWSPLSGRRLPATHYHAFELNWWAERGRMRTGDLRMAQEIEQELQGFEELRTYAGIQFRIKDIDVVTGPEWEYTLFNG